MKRAVFEALEEARAELRPVARAVSIPSGEDRLLFGETDEPLDHVALDALRTDKAREVELDGVRWFVQPFNPPLRLVVVGAVHIAQPLARMAALADYAVTVVDPREAFARAERFPGVTIDHGWPDEALEKLKPDTRTAIVTLTHDPKLDDPALQVALRSPAFFIGCLGSKRTHASRLSRLEKKGFDAGALARIHGPVGLPLGGRSPAEVAVSIMAQIVQVLRTGE